MKRYIFPLLFPFLFCIFFPVASFAEGNRSITVLYTDSVKGTIDPLIGCSCSKSGSLGGLARRAHMVESIRKEKRSVLLLDNGEVFDPQKDTAELYLKAMGQMGYDALNIGSPELYSGKEFLERTHSQVSFPYISSNLLYGGIRPPWIREYVIKEVGGIKVAILGVLDPEDFKKIPRSEDLTGFEVIPPEAALGRLLPKIRGSADIVILLSQLGEKKILALLKAVQGIDVAIFSVSHFHAKAPEKNVIALQTPAYGTALGVVSLVLDEKLALSVSERKDVPLDDSVSDNEEMLALIEPYKKEQEIKIETARKEEEIKWKKELMEGLQLSPQEFMERYREKQADRNK